MLEGTSKMLEFTGLASPERQRSKEGTDPKGSKNWLM
jgi:hypothetical protein